jgi:hypothetical protein
VVSGWVKHLTERPFATLGGRAGCITGKSEVTVQTRRFHSQPIVSEVGMFRQLRSGHLCATASSDTSHPDVTNFTDKTRSFVSHGD